MSRLKILCEEEALTRLKKVALYVLVVLALAATLTSVAYAQDNETEPVEPTPEGQPLSEDLVWGAVFISLLIGVSIKTFLPFYRKAIKEKEFSTENFDIRYLAIFFVNLLAVVGQAVKLFPKVPLPEIYLYNELGSLALAALFTGMGQTWLVDEGSKWFGFFKK